MNLKFYLRGLGLGLIVAALILGIHHLNSSKQTMTDSEIIERAEELGMVDGSTTLVDPAKETEEMLEDIEEQSAEAGGSENGTDILNSDSILDQNNSTENDNTQDIDVTDVTSSAEAFLNDDNSELIEDTTSEITTDAYDDPDSSKNNGSDNSTDNSSADSTDQSNVNEEANASGDSDTASAEASNEGSQTSTTGADYPTEDATLTVTSSSTTATTGSFTISSGDSSDRVARKLADAGYISSASEFDKYLCANGYDRIIRTGNYNITEGMTNEDIAKMITGK